jgi:hypothetical protein
MFLDVWPLRVGAPPGLPLRSLLIRVLPLAPLGHHLRPSQILLPLGSMLRIISHREPPSSCTGQLSRSRVGISIFGPLPSSNLLAVFLAVDARFCPSLCFPLGTLPVGPLLGSVSLPVNPLAFLDVWPMRIRALPGLPFRRLVIGALPLALPGHHIKPLRMRLPLGSILRVKPPCSGVGEHSRPHAWLSISGPHLSVNFLAGLLAIRARVCPFLCFNLGALPISPPLCFLLGSSPAGLFRGARYSGH